MVNNEPNYNNLATISADNVKQRKTDSAILPRNISGTVTYYQGKISVKKVDAETGEVLSNALFTLFGDHNQALKTKKRFRWSCNI